MIAKRVPGQLTDLTVILVRIVAPMGQDDIWLRPGLEAFHPGLQLPAVVGKEAVPEPLQLDLHTLGSGRERLGGGLRLGGALAGGAQDAPVDIQADASIDPAEDGGAGADLDIVGVCAETEHGEPFAGSGEPQSVHAACPPSGVLPRPAPRRQGVLPCSIRSSSVCRSRSVSIERQKLSCL